MLALATQFVVEISINDPMDTHNRIYKREVNSDLLNIVLS